MASLTRFFDVILKGESKTYNDHNWYVSGSRLKGYIEGVSQTKYPLLAKPLSEYTIGEIINFQKRPRDSQGQLWATGRYQIIPSTLLGLVNKTNLSRNLKYDRKNQDFLAYQLLIERKPIKNYIEKRIEDNQRNLELAALEVAKIWSSVGVPFDTQGSRRFVKKNESFYSGGGDKASVKTEDAQAALRILRNGGVTQPETKPAPTKINTKTNAYKYFIISGIFIGISAIIYLKKRNSKN
jgi:hypothetical protein